MRKIMIFGAGLYGRNAYYKLKKLYSVQYFIDNNLSLQGKEMFDIPIISVDLLAGMDTTEMDIFICTASYHSVELQLNRLGIRRYYIMLAGFLYRTSPQERMVSVELNPCLCHKKKQAERNILFVQDAACIRTHRIAACMKEAGYRVYLLYTLAPPEDGNRNFAEVYDDIFTFFTPCGMLHFIEQSEFDIIHSSNAPDLLTNLLLTMDKSVVFDTHDMSSLRGNDSAEEMVMEYVANVYSGGNIYASDAVAKTAKRKYGLEMKKTLTIENYVFEQIEIPMPYDKLSLRDHEIHCVYEGTISDNTENHRYFEKIWKEIADQGIHVHFYSNSHNGYCRDLDEKSKFFHYEGNLGTYELIQEMTKYDCGLALFNVTEKNCVFLESTTMNKIYEYLNAQLPILVGGIKQYKKFVEKYNIGIWHDPGEDIGEQIKRTCRKKVSPNFLQEHQLTIKSVTNGLIEFYKNVASSK